MKKRIREENINTKEYLDQSYKDFKGNPSVDYRLQRLVEIVGKYKNVLDVGCADGGFLKYYAEKHKESDLYGIDLSKEAIKMCVIGDCRQGSIYKLPFDEKTFDLVTCSELMEHLEHPEEAIKEMKRVLKENGVLAITTPNESDGVCEEHLWNWDFDGFREMLKGFELMEYRKEFCPHIMLFICKSV